MSQFLPEFCSFLKLKTSRSRRGQFAHLAAIAFLIVAGCTSPKERDFSEYSQLPAIKTYLSDRVCSKGFGGKTYAAYEVLGTETEGNTEQLYLWVLCQEFYQKNGKLEQGTGSSSPVRLTVARSPQEFKVLSHQQPRSGTLYAEDLQKMFPERIIKSWNSQGTEAQNIRVKKLQDEVEAEAKRK
ncbi:hypothetical protein [Oscillatoria sp. FACHB-1406]|uniref:hypothetical protein n=1 Tax=Oscillatoria sp. FACHB-1406 TaxID=2692846 RepID=UPI0016851D61|nr:hypothetical protein [Oscillatoria sp. FACHB-1406]MBD2576824.1 hypothetical protein [Oscillatoria sp. FACHB-1406]